MLSAWLYAIVSVIIVSLVAVVAIIPVLLKKKSSEGFLVFLLSVSVGVILATVFFDFMPEVYEHGYSNLSVFYILGGFLVMFVVEKFVHFHHSRKCDKGGTVGHSHAYSLAPVNLIGDSIHNFIDGLIIAGAYMVSIPVGISATVSIIFHEIPQEIADFGVLLYSGLTKKKALFFNFLSATTAILGTIIGLILVGNVEWFNMFLIPFAAGNFLYIASVNLLPQLHRHCKLKETFLHVLAIILGVGIIVGLASVFPHVH